MPIAGLGTILGDTMIKFFNSSVILTVAAITLASPAHADPTISTAYTLPDKVIKVLKEIATEAGDNEIRVSSFERTPKQQVEAMIDYYIECNKGRFRGSSICGVNRARTTYCELADPAIDKYSSTGSREKVVEAMAKELTKSLKGKSNRTCLMHVVGKGFNPPHYSVDIAPSSVDDAKSFISAVEKHPSVVTRRFYYPNKPGSTVKESAYHIEIPR